VTAVRLAYFGDIVPNTFHAKSGAWNMIHLRSVADFGASAFGALSVAALASAAAALLLGRRPQAPPRAALDAAIASAIAVVVQVAAYSRSELAMDYAYRFAFHSLGYVIVGLLAIVHVGVAGAAAVSDRISRAAVGAVVTLGALASASRGVDRARVESDRSALYERDLRTVYLPAARWVLDHTSKEATLSVYPDAGLVPYVSRRRTIDFGRLNDRKLARMRVATDVAAYFFVTDPDVALFTVRGQIPWDDGAATTLADPRFAERYRLEERFATSWGPALLVYARVR
jgi:hypothetical protein